MSRKGDRHVVKPVLMVVYQYPPEGGSSGVLRSLKYSKYLPLHGWTPHILTPKEWVFAMRDHGLVRDIPAEAVVHRTFALDNTRHLSIRGRHLAALGVPDPYVSWVPFAVARGIRVIRKAGIRALYSTSPPATTHLIAASLKSLTGLPWIADFRDPWIEEGIHPRPGSFRWRVESALERAVVSRADRLVMTTPYLRREFLARYPGMPEEKARVIYNGYDEDDFRDLGNIVMAPRFEILHAGLVTPEYRDPFPLLAAVSRLTGEGRIRSEEVRVTFLGGGDYIHSERFIERVRGMGLEGIVDVAGRVSHRESIDRLRSAAVLLLLQASEDTRTLIPAKAFEYLRMGKPILGLTLEGATADLLNEMEECHVVDPEDGERLASTVTLLYDRWRGGGSRGVPPRPIQKYERRRLTGDLAILLDGITGG